MRIMFLYISKSSVPGIAQNGKGYNVGTAGLLGLCPVAYVCGRTAMAQYRSWRFEANLRSEFSPRQREQHRALNDAGTLLNTLPSWL